MVSIIILKLNINVSCDGLFHLLNLEMDIYKKIFFDFYVNNKLKKNQIGFGQL